MTPLSFAAFTASTVLVSLLGARLFASPRFAVLTGVLFVLTPLLWRQTQDASGSLYALPFVAGWLFIVRRWSRCRRDSRQRAARS